MKRLPVTFIQRILPISGVMFSVQSTWIIAGLAFILAPIRARADVLYVPNAGTMEILEFASDGTRSVFSPNNGFNISLRDIAFDSAGTVYASSEADANGYIIRYTAAGVPSFFASGNMNGARGIAFDSAGNLFVACAVTNTIRMITPAGVGSTFASTGLNAPQGLAFDSSGNLFVANASDNTIEKFTPGGVGSVFATNVGGSLNEPWGLAFDQAGNLFVANSGFPYTIEKFTPSGTPSVFATNASGLSNPTGVAVDSAGFIYVANFGPGTILKFTPGGVGSVFATGLSAVYFIGIASVPPLQLTAAVSRKTHGGAGTFDIPLPLTGDPGVECRSSGGNHTLVFTFNNNVVSGNASVTSGTGNVAGSPTFSANTMTVNLTGVADVQKITVTLSGVTDIFSQVLAGTAVSVNMLIGDTTGNKAVNASDAAQTKAQSGVPVTSANFRSDVNVSGAINAGDVAQVKANAGHTLP